MKRQRLCSGQLHAVIMVVVLLLTVAAVPAIAEEPTPEPYKPNEFPQWAQDLRRGSVIAFGAVPVTVLLARIVYDVGRFTIRSVEQGQIAVRYAPLFFAPPDGVPLSDDDDKRILTIGVSGAAVVALADYIMGVWERRQ